MLWLGGRLWNSSGIGGRPRVSETADKHIFSEDQYAIPRFDADIDASLSAGGNDLMTRMGVTCLSSMEPGTGRAATVNAPVSFACARRDVRAACENGTEVASMNTLLTDARRSGSRPPKVADVTSQEYSPNARPR